MIGIHLWHTNWNLIKKSRDKAVLKFNGTYLAALVSSVQRERVEGDDHCGGYCVDYYPKAARSIDSRWGEVGETGLCDGLSCIRDCNFFAIFVMQANGAQPVILKNTISESQKSEGKGKSF